MPKNRRVIYADGYEHLSHRRDEFIRNQIFGAYKSMTLEQLRKMAEVAAFRAEDARLHELSP